jgi:thiamine kinase-like enzyme
MPDSIVEDRIADLPCWRAMVTIEPLAGGMTNRNFLVDDGAAGKFVVRVGRDLPEHGVMRFNELAAARAAFAAGISPEVVFAGDGLLVIRHIESRTLEPADIRDRSRLPALLDLVRRCHYDIPPLFRGPALAFWVFQILRNYLALLGQEPGSCLFPQLARLRAIAVELEAAVGPIELVFGHNDLLAANFLDDGSRLWLIDWDYAGFNSPMFDLANLSSNNQFDSADDDALLDLYGRGGSGPARRRAFEAMKCASLLRETFWGAVSELRSTIDFDYASYTRDYLQRLDAAWASFKARS